MNMPWVSIDTGELSGKYMYHQTLKEGQGLLFCDFLLSKYSQTLPNQTAHYYQQFALSLAKESPHSFSKFKPLIMDTPLIRTLYALLRVLIKGIWRYSIWIVPWVVWANGCRDDTWPVVGTKCPFICWHPFPPLWSSVIQSHTRLDTSVEDKQCYHLF